MTELKAEQQLVTASEENNEPQSLLEDRKSTRLNSSHP